MVAGCGADVGAGEDSVLGALVGAGEASVEGVVDVDGVGYDVVAAVPPSLMQ